MKPKTTILVIVIATLAVFGAVNLLALPFPMVIAVTLISFQTFATILIWKYRIAFAFLSISMLLVFNVLDVPHLIEFASWDVILFLISMMTVIGYLEEKGFFEHLLHQIMKFTGGGTMRLMIILMISSAFFAALVDEVTSILFMSAMMLHLTAKYKVRAIPFIMMLVFATNIGSSATVVGNPVGVMIAFRGGLTFADFFRWATPISIGALGICIALCLTMFRGPIKELEIAMTNDIDHVDDEATEELTLKESLICWALFAGTIILLALHHPLEELLHLPKNTLLIGTALGAAAVALLIDLDKGREVLERRVDWRTLIFFALLFASVGALQYVGVTDLLAQTIFAVSGGSELSLLVILTASISLLTAFLDNVLAVAIFMPVVTGLGEAGAQTFPLWWAMLFSGCFFGNATIIGSTANIVALGMHERENRGHISFLEWVKYGSIIAFTTLLFAMVALYLQIPLMS